MVAKLFDIVFDDSIELLVRIELVHIVDVGLERQRNLLTRRLEFHFDAELGDFEVALIVQANVAGERFADVQIAGKFKNLLK